MRNTPPADQWRQGCAGGLAGAVAAKQRSDLAFGDLDPDATEEYGSGRSRRKDLRLGRLRSCGLATIDSVSH